MSKTGNKIINSKYGWLLLLIILVAVNWLASVFHTRFDLTKEKRYTLSKGTKDILRNLDERVEIDIFLKGDFPSKFRKLTNRVDEFVQTLKDASGSKLRYRFISPTEEVPGTTGINYGDSLVRMNAQPINLKAQVETGESSSLAFPYAWIRYKGKQELITLFTPPPFFSENNDDPEKVINNAEALMEYQFAKGLSDVTTDRKIGIAYSVGNGEPTDWRAEELVKTFEKDYQFGILDLKTQFIPNAVDLLMIVKPTEEFTENEKLKIDQFIMNGGRLLCFIDNLIAEQDSLAIKPETIAYDRNLNLTDLFFRYGLRINTDLVMDLQCDFLPFVIGGNAENPQMQFLRWNYYPFLNPTNNQIGRNLGYVRGRFVNSIDAIQVKDVTRTPLLVSSPNSRIISTPALISLNENKNVPEDAKFNRDSIPVAMLLEGKFTSLYRNRSTQAQRDSLSAVGLSFLSESKENKMIVVADGDIVLNDVIPDEQTGGPVSIPMGYNKYTYSEYLKQSETGKLFVPAANQNFLMNCVEYLTSNEAVAATRNKDIVLRLLDSERVKDQKSMWQFLNIGLPVVLVLLFALVYQQLRRRKYAS